MMPILLFLSAAAVAVSVFFAVRTVRTEDEFLSRMSHLARSIVELNDRQNEFEDRLDKLKELEELPSSEMEQRIAERIEKKWDDGLQSILDFNPLTGRRGDSEGVTSTASACLPGRTSRITRSATGSTTKACSSTPGYNWMRT